VSDASRSKLHESFKSISEIKIVTVRADDHLPCRSCEQYGPVAVIKTPDGSVDLCRSCLRMLRSRLQTRLKINRVVMSLRQIADDIERLAS
jgi:late competence protein required for DNA uptake (superfamily II DNA/RNA helicase)